MDQDALSWIVAFEESRCPIREVCREIVHRKCSRLLGIPLVRHGPEQVGSYCGLFGEHRPLGVSHHPAPGRFLNARELASRYKGRLGSAGVPALRGHEIGEIDSSGLNPDEHLSRFGRRRWNITYLQNFGTTQACDDDALHGDEFIRAKAATSARSRTQSDRTNRAKRASKHCFTF